MLNHFPFLPLVTLSSSFHGRSPRRAWFCSMTRSLLRLLSPQGANPGFSDVPCALGAPAPNHLGSSLDLAPVCQNSSEQDKGSY